MTHEQFIYEYLQDIKWAIKKDYLRDYDVLYVDDDLYFKRTNITLLPDNLYVGGYLDLEYTKIITLPKKLSIGGDLWIRFTNIATLPEDLFVGKNLWLRDNKVTSLPEGLSVGGEIHSHRKLYMPEALQQTRISQNKNNFNIIKNPTENAKALYKLLWEL